MKLIWDQIGERFFTTGVDHGVLYPQKGGAYPKGVAWSGLTGVTLSPSGAEENSYYADNIKYLAIRGAEDFGGTIECYYYPDEWEACNGEVSPVKGVTLSQQARNTFGFSYQNKLGNDTDGVDHAYQIHLVYGASASPSEKSTSTINESPEPTTLSYEFTTVPVPVSVTGPEGEVFKPTAHIMIDSREHEASKMTEFMNILYGSGADETGTDARLPMPDEVLTFFGLAAG